MGCGQEGVRGVEVRGDSIPVRRLCPWLVALVAVVPAPAGAQTIDATAPVVVAFGTVAQPLYEPHMAVDPTDPRRLLAAAIVGRDPRLQYPEGMEEQLCVVLRSTDGGAAWTRHELDATECFDPWVTITPGGEALVTILGRSPRFPHQGGSGLLAYHSADGGATWDAPVPLGRAHDHPTTTVDSSSGPRRGWIYVTSHRGARAEDGRLRYGLWLARSRDGGRTFDDPVHVIPNNLHNLAEMPVVLPDGSLIATYVDASYTRTGSDGDPEDTGFERRRAWAVRSTDGGHSFSVPLFVTDACGPPPGYRLSAAAADTTNGPFSGRLYFACREAEAGPILVVASDNAGETWTAPVRLEPPGGSLQVKDRIPGITVSDAGVVLASWIEAPGTPDRPCEERVYATASLDGGRTFAPASLVSSTPACAQGTPVARSTGGDYFGAVSTPDGRFRLLWSETRDGVSSLMTSVIDVIR